MINVKFIELIRTPCLYFKENIRYSAEKPLKEIAGCFQLCKEHQTLARFPYFDEYYPKLLLKDLTPKMIQDYYSYERTI